VQVRDNAGDVMIEVKENPVVNRIILEGNKRLKEDKILPEIKLAARQIFTRSKVRADVARIIELYKRQGRFAASIEPKMVMLDQNRVDIVFEISEGPKSKVRQINIIGNERFNSAALRSEMVTKQARAFRLFSSGTSYDPDRLAFDQQKLRQFYLTNGYADFRVVSAVAELTPDKRDFIITYVVEEGQRYKFGDVKVDSQLRDFDGDSLAKRLPLKPAQWYNAKLVEDTVDSLDRNRRQLRLCLCRRAARLQPQQGRPDDVGDLPHCGSAARLCRAGRCQRQLADAGQGRAPRIPYRRRRCVQLVPDQALRQTASSRWAISRKSSRSSRSRAAHRTASCLRPTSKSAPPGSCSFRAGSQP